SYNSINAGGGNNLITSGERSTIRSGDGDDSITAGGWFSQIYAGDGDNRIVINTSYSSTVETGNGNDIIDLTSTTGTSYITTGIGNDKIIGLTSGSTINVAASVSSVTSGSDLILNNRYGSITVEGGANKNYSVIVDGSIDTTPAPINFVYDESRASVTVNATFHGSIDPDDYDSSVRLIDASQLTVGTYISGNDNDNTIISSSNGDTLNGGSGSDVFVVNGNDVIVDYSAADDSIKVDGDIDASIESGNDVILTVGSSSVTISNGKDQELNIIGNGEYLVGDEKANVLRAGDEGATLEGLGGNDKLYGGDGRDVFVWTVGDGNDQIYNYDAEDGDVIKVNGMEVAIDATYFKESGKKLTFKLGKEKITVNDVKDKPVTFDYGSGTFTYNATLAEGLTLSSNKKTLTVEDPFEGSINLEADFSSKVKTVDATTLTDEIYIVGNKKANVIYAGIAGSTLDGGLGSNKLYGGDGEDVFIHSGGKDQIINYEADDGDQIVLNGSVDKVTVSTKDVKLKIGKGTITIKDVTGESVWITDADGETNEYVFTKTNNTMDKARVSDELSEIIAVDESSVDLPEENLFEGYNLSMKESALSSARSRSKK
ncbi:MAG: calcium-binding protein, partial [Selenomonadaceae bacterium]|nr:calcium-binding protein [Selenomonadaceae bacterium]